MPTATTDRFFTWPFALAFAANFFQGLALHPYLHLPGFLTELGAGEAMVGLIFGWMSGAAIAIRPLAGRVMDGAGRRVVIVGGGILHVVACLLYLSVDSIGPWLFVVRSVQGFAEGAIFSSLFTYAADIVPPSRRTQGIALFGVSGMLPMSVGGLVGDWVLSRWDYHELFQLTAVLAVVALLVSLPLAEPERARAGAPVGFFGALRQRDLMPIWFVGSTFATALAGLFAFLKTYTETVLHYGSVGLFFSWYTGAAILLRVGLGWLPDRVGAFKVLYPSMGAIALSMIALAGSTSEAWIALAGVLAGAGHGFAFPILSAIVVDRANAADRGSAMALFTAIFDAGILIGSPLLGLLVEATDYRTMYLAAAAVPLVGTAVFHLWDARAITPNDA